MNSTQVDSRVAGLDCEHEAQGQPARPPVHGQLDFACSYRIPFA